MEADAAKWNDDALRLNTVLALLPLHWSGYATYNTIEWIPPAGSHIQRRMLMCLLHQP